MGEVLSKKTYTFFLLFQVFVEQQSFLWHLISITEPCNVIVVKKEALIKTVIRLAANVIAKKISWEDNVPVVNQISLDFPIVNSVIVHQLHDAMKKQVRFKKN